MLREQGLGAHQRRAARAGAVLGALSERLASSGHGLPKAADAGSELDGAAAAVRLRPEARTVGAGSGTQRPAALEQNTVLEGDFDGCGYTLPHPAAGCGWLRDSHLWPSRGSAAGASGPRWRRMWILLWRRAPTRAGTSLVKDGLLGPRLHVGACAPMVGEA